jgi:hypothetical protein
MTTPGFSLRTTIFSVVLALALWLFVSMRSTYEVVTSVPLEFVLPSNRSIETLVASDVRLKLRATGWHLINILYLNAQSSCVLDLTQSTSTSARIGIQDMKLGFRAPVPATVVEVLSDEFDVQLGIVGQKRVPLRSQVRVETAPGFMVVGSTEMMPDSVNIRGNIKVLSAISSWPTRAREIAGIKEDITGYVGVSDSLRANITVEPKAVYYRARVQRSADVEIEDVPVVIQGAPNAHSAPSAAGANGPSSAHSLLPMRVSVSVRGGIQVVEALTANDISVSVDYAQLLNDTTGSIIPTVNAPASVRVLAVQPARLLHTVLSSERPRPERAATRRRN